MKRNYLKNILKGISLTSVMFIFQACYGSPQDFLEDVHIEGKVFSAKTGKPIPGIVMKLTNSNQNLQTDNTGLFSFYTFKYNTYTFSFEDTDDQTNGLFEKMDTTIKSGEKKIYFEIKLNEK